MTSPGRRDAGIKTAAAAALVSVLLGIWAGIRVHSNRVSDRDPGSLRVPAGEASPPAAADFAEADAAAQAAVHIPEHLPDFTLSDFNGKPTAVTLWAGKSLVLNFWATWCAPCRREIPLLKALSSAWAERGVEVVGVAVDHRDQVAAFVEEMKIAYPILVGEEDALDVAAKLGVGSPVFPFTVFTDRRGEVVALYVGELHKAEADLIVSAVQHVNDNEVGLAEAQRHIADGLRALRGATPTGAGPAAG